MNAHIFYLFGHFNLGKMCCTVRIPESKIMGVYVGNTIVSVGHCQCHLSCAVTVRVGCPVCVVLPGTVRLQKPTRLLLLLSVQLHLPSQPSVLSRL